MENLVEFFNTKDYRYFLNVDFDDLPEKYNIDELIPIADVILKEHEILRGDNYYTNFITNEDFNVNDIIKLTLMNGLIEAYECGKITLKLRDAADKLADELNVKSKDDAIILRNRITQKLQIKAVKESGIVHSNVSFGAMLADIHFHTGVELTNPTIAIYCRHEQIMKTIISEKRKNGKV